MNQIQPTHEDKRQMLDGLKENWKQDPCWDIEDTEGFEEFHNELLAWRKEYEAKWHAEQSELRMKRLKWIGEEDDLLLADAIHTPEEIEKEVEAIGNYTDIEVAQISLMKEQVRATVLLTIQVKRVADLLQDQSANESISFNTRLYKVE